VSDNVEKHFKTGGDDDDDDEIKYMILLQGINSVKTLRLVVCVFHQ
jgi:hypothetical protein